MASTRTVILDAALAILRDAEGPKLTLQSAAKASGLTKPGLMYHFPTKDALVRGVLNHVATAWAARFAEHLGRPADEATPEERIRAYVEVTVSAGLDLADLAVFFDAHYHETLAAIWAERIGPWVDIPDTVPRAQRGRLAAARLAADGYWFADTSGTLQPRAEDRSAIIAAILSLIDEA
jgi:AcrR family transcriptional regulator